MKPEVLIKNWLMSWLRPEKETEFNTVEKLRPAIIDSEQSFGEFIKIFTTENRRPYFSHDEQETLRPLITKPLKFGTGYPGNSGEAIQALTVYLVQAGWSQTQKEIGAHYWDGRAATHIVITGATVGDNHNMSQPSLLLEMITSLLLTGRDYFIANHLKNPVIEETLYSADEKNSYDRKFAMRSLTMSYEAHRFEAITNYGVIENGTQ